MLPAARRNSPCGSNLERCFCLTISKLNLDKCKCTLLLGGHWGGLPPFPFPTSQTAAASQLAGSASPRGRVGHLPAACGTTASPPSEDSPKRRSPLLLLNPICHGVTANQMQAQAEPADDAGRRSCLTVLLFQLLRTTEDAALGPEGRRLRMSGRAALLLCRFSGCAQLLSLPSIGVIGLDT